MSEDVHVIIRPGTSVDLENLERWCGEWAEQLGGSTCVVAASDPAAVAAAIRSAAAAVVAPGSAGDHGAVLSAAAATDVVWVDLHEAERAMRSLDAPALLEEESLEPEEVPALALVRPAGGGKLAP